MSKEARAIIEAGIDVFTEGGLSGGYWLDRTKPLHPAVAKALIALKQAAGEAERITATIIGPPGLKFWLEKYTLVKRGRQCIHRIADVPCPDREPGFGFDHTHIWKRKRDGALVLLTHPYDVRDDTLAELMDFARQHDLYVSISAQHAAWYFPGFAVSILVRRRSDGVD